jgi:magnesium chelatase subunit D
VSEGPLFPFSAVVGQDDVKLALLLAAVDPTIAGVLLRGEKGSAKTTLARGLAALLPGAALFVELPVGATEDRLIGTLDLAAALTGGERRFEPGLLAAAHGGVLYVDEVNLLPDHLVDVLLDVAASGVNRVEREGVSHRHASRFILIGSMNPEEGDLRPQLLDRFGLAVDVRAPVEPPVRAEAVRRRLAYDADAGALVAAWAGAEAELAGRLAAALPAGVPDALMEEVSRLCASVGAQGLRADLTICRAAAALAGFEGRPTASRDDVRRVAPLALAHRRRQNPFDSSGISPDELEQAMDEAAGGPSCGDGGGERSGDGGGESSMDGGGESSGNGGGEKVVGPDTPTAVMRLVTGAAARETMAPGRRTTVEGSRGRMVADRVPDGPIKSLAVGATMRAAAVRRSGHGATAEAAPGVVAADLREAVRQQRVGNLIVLAVDASGSMGADRRMEAAKGAVLSLLLDAYQRRDKVAMVTFRGDGAEVALKATGSVEVARARLADLPTGGRTPLAAGIQAALDVATAPGSTGSHTPLLVLITDGRATAAPPGEDPLAQALVAAAAVRRRRIDAVVVDAEDGSTRLGLARQLAEAMGARYVTLPELSAGALETAVRTDWGSRG